VPGDPNFAPHLRGFSLPAQPGDFTVAGATECEKDVMAYRVVLVLKSGEHEARDAWTSPWRTPVIGEVIELSIDARVLRARVKGIAKAPADKPDPEERADLVIAKEI
jgi:hypothetical protein